MKYIVAPIVLLLSGIGFSQENNTKKDSVKTLKEVVISANQMIGSKFEAANKTGSASYISPEDLKKFNYTDHLVFSYNFYSFMFICLILFEFVGFISEDISLFLVGISFSILFPIYLYKSLRYFYQNSRWKTIFKFLLLNILFIPISLLAVFVLMAVSIILF